MTSYVGLNVSLNETSVCVLDEHGTVRSHVNVFTHGARSGEAAPVGEDDVIHVLAAISGGAR